MCGPDVKIALGEHSIDRPGVAVIFSGKPDLKPTIIGDDVWIGANSLIRSGVSIGRGAVVAMGSVVVKDVEPYSVVAGVPARKLRMRFNVHEILQHETMLNDKPLKGVYCEKSRS
ncbi:MAG: DapH/DapD/GlmU-related protein [Coraliomargarita sp.]